MKAYKCHSLYFYLYQRHQNSAHFVTKIKSSGLYLILPQNLLHEKDVEQVDLDILNNFDMSDFLVIKLPPMYEEILFCIWPLSCWQACRIIGHIVFKLFLGWLWSYLVPIDQISSKNIFGKISYYGRQWLQQLMLVLMVLKKWQQHVTSN